MYRINSTPLCRMIDVFLVLPQTRLWALLLCLGETPAPLHVLWLSLVWLCLEASELKTLQPLRSDMLPANPCKAETLGA